MFGSIRKRATFANICSFLALSIALSMGTAYAAGTVRSKDIVNGQVKNVDLGANSVTTGKIKDGEVQAGDLGAGSVDSSKILDASVGAGDLGTNSVGSDEIATDAVAATEIADGSIDSGEIVDDSLFASDLAAASVGTSEIADGTVTGTDIAGSTITGGDVASNTITTADIAGTDASGSISLGSGSIGVGRCEFFNISVPGALADQTVIISARDPLPEGQILYGVGVPSSDLVTMAACNFSGGTWDALSNFPIRTVTFG
jgi:hypothetical protein